MPGNTTRPRPGAPARSRQSRPRHPPSGWTRTPAGSNLATTRSTRSRSLSLDSFIHFSQWRADRPHPTPRCASSSTFSVRAMIVNTNRISMVPRTNTLATEGEPLAQRAPIGDLPHRAGMADVLHRRNLRSHRPPSDRCTTNPAPPHSPPHGARTTHPPPTTATQSTSTHHAWPHPSPQGDPHPTHRQIRRASKASSASVTSGRNSGGAPRSNRTAA